MGGGNRGEQEGKIRVGHRLGREGERAGREGGREPSQAWAGTSTGSRRDNFMEMKVNIGDPSQQEQEGSRWLWSGAAGGGEKQVSPQQG